MSQAVGVPPWVNQIMKFTLRSPAHRLVSKSILLISFTGRMSGKSYATPVSYSRDGEQVTVFTHARWWKNLQIGSLVTLRIQGQNRKGLVEPIEKDRHAIAAALADHLRQVPGDARWYSVTLDGGGNPDPAEVEKAVQTVVMLRFQLC